MYLASIANIMSMIITTTNMGGSCLVIYITFSF